MWLLAVCRAFYCWLKKNLFLQKIYIYISLLAAHICLRVPNRQLHTVFLRNGLYRATVSFHKPRTSAQQRKFSLQKKLPGAFA